MARQLQTLSRRLFSTSVHVEPRDLREYIDDISLLLPERHELIRVELKALSEYIPRPYPGRVTIFRARRQSLICSYDPKLGWGKFAMGVVDVQHAAGYHRNLLEIPYVQRLATDLKECLDSARHAAVGS